MFKKRLHRILLLSPFNEISTHLVHNHSTISVKNYCYIRIYSCAPYSTQHWRVTNFHVQVNFSLFCEVYLNRTIKLMISISKPRRSWRKVFCTILIKERKVTFVKCETIVTAGHRQVTCAFLTPDRLIDLSLDLNLSFDLDIWLVSLVCNMFFLPVVLDAHDKL